MLGPERCRPCPYARSHGTTRQPRSRSATPPVAPRTRSERQQTPGPRRRGSQWSGTAPPIGSQHSRPAGRPGPTPYLITAIGAMEVSQACLAQTRNSPIARRPARRLAPSAGPPSPPAEQPHAGHPREVIASVLAQHPSLQHKRGASSVGCDHPAVRGAVIAFMVERSPRPVGNSDETDRQRVAAHTTASGAPATVELAGSGLVLPGEPLVASDPAVSVVATRRARPHCRLSSARRR